MHSNLKISLDRADELLKELMTEYEKCLKAKEVSGRATQLTHEVCERLRSVLDRAAYLYWDQKVSPELTEEDRQRATIYFPIADKQNGFDSTLGRWRWQKIRNKHEPIYDFLLALQPFTSSSNRWLAVLADLANQGKHIDLVPQKRIEDRRITVERQGGGAVSWNSGVQFGRGVSVMGAPIDPTTQRIVPTPGVTEKIETWVSFLIQEHNVNAAGFCKEACDKVRRIIVEMSERCALS